MIDDLYHKYGIPIAPEGHKHSRPGWINIECPHCQGSGFHLGFNLSNAYFYCFRCGSHTIASTIMKLLRVSYIEAESVIKTYKLKRKQNFQIANTSKSIKINQQSFKFPSDVVDLQKPHRNYLIKRNFDPDKLIKLWEIKGTSPTSFLSIKRDGFNVKIDYRYRILIPIEWDDRNVTFQARDYTGKQEIKYKACPEEREEIHHKHILYGHPSLWLKKRAIVVEGVFDVWRLGVNACCTFGTGYTSDQVRVMIDKFEEVFILFDPEPIAQRRAKELQQELAFWGVKAHLYNPGHTTDPGDMTEEEVRYILKDLKMS